MDEFAHGLQERVAETRRSLAAAQEDGDDYGVEVHGEELADLARLAREHGLDVDLDASHDASRIDLTTLDLPALDSAALDSCEEATRAAC